MTDRVNKLTVVLTDSFRVDDILYLTKAISMLNGVAAVEVGDPNDIGIEGLVESRYRSSLLIQLHEFAKTFKIEP